MNLWRPCLQCFLLGSHNRYPNSSSVLGKDRTDLGRDTTDTDNDLTAAGARPVLRCWAGPEENIGKPNLPRPPPNTLSSG